MGRYCNAAKSVKDLKMEAATTCGLEEKLVSGWDNADLKWNEKDNAYFPFTDPQHEEERQKVFINLKKEWETASKELTLDENCDNDKTMKHCYNYHRKMY